MPTRLGGGAGPFLIRPRISRNEEGAIGPPILVYDMEREDVPLRDRPVVLQGDALGSGLAPRVWGPHWLVPGAEGGEPAGQRETGACVDRQEGCRSQGEAAGRPERVGGGSGR